MLKGVTLEANGRFALEGYPDGATVHCLATCQGQEFIRLATFARDLEQLIEWLDLSADGAPQTREAQFIAALIRFCGCFRSTSGIRQKPLSVRRIFEPQDRKIFSKIKNIRDKMAAHDEQLYASAYPLFVLDGEGKAIHTIAFMMHPIVHSLKEGDDLLRLASIALKWVRVEFDKVSAEIVNFIDALPLARRLRIKESPEFQIRINRKDLH